MDRNGALLHDVLETTRLVCPFVVLRRKYRLETQVWQLAWRRSLTAWFYIPIGVLCILLACWGVDSLIGLSSVSFPASVALLLVLFFALIICETFLGDRRTKKLVHVIDIPVSVQISRPCI